MMPIAPILAALFFASVITRSGSDHAESIIEDIIRHIPERVRGYLLRACLFAVPVLLLSLSSVSLYYSYKIHAEGNRLMAQIKASRALLVAHTTTTLVADSTATLKLLDMRDIARPEPIAQDDVSFTSPYRLNIRQDRP